MQIETWCPEKPPRVAAFQRPAIGRLPAVPQEGGLPAPLRLRYGALVALPRDGAWAPPQARREGAVTG